MGTSRGPPTLSYAEEPLRAGQSLSHDLTTVPGGNAPKESHTPTKLMSSRDRERPAEHLDTSLAGPEP